MAKNSLVLLLGGSGHRFGSEIPKQFLSVSQKNQQKISSLSGVSLPSDTVLFSATAFVLGRTLKIQEMVLVVEPDFQEHDIVKTQVANLKNWLPSIEILITTGGETRHQILCNGIEMISGKNEAVLVQDSNRPFMEEDFLNRIQENLKRLSIDEPCFIPVLPAIDSLVVTVESRIESYLPRERIQHIQTPQLLFLPAAKKAIAGRNSRDYSDEGSLMLSAGMKVLPFQGSSLNVKVTYPADWEK